MGFLLDIKLPFRAVKSIALRLWVREGLYDVLAQGNGVFYFYFSNDSALNAVLEGGPLLIADRHIFLRKWEPGQGLKFYKGTGDKILVWIRLHNVPLEYWLEEGLSHLASAVGVPLYADSSTENCRRVCFAIICMELDAAKPLVKEFEVVTLNGNLGSSSNSLSSGYTKIRVSYQ